MRKIRKVIGPLHVNLNVNLEKLPESPPPGSPLPVLPPPPTPEEKLSPDWELPDNGNNFMNCYTQAYVLELRNWAQETSTMSEEGYVVEAPLVSQNFLASLQENHG